MSAPIDTSVLASGGNFLVTLWRVSTRLLEQVGAPPEAIVPLMTRTIENGFDLTGPIARGDWTTVEAHLAALEELATARAVASRARSGACGVFVHPAHWGSPATERPDLWDPRCRLCHLVDGAGARHR